MKLHTVCPRGGRYKFKLKATDLIGYFHAHAFVSLINQSEINCKTSVHHVITNKYGFIFVASTNISLKLLTAAKWSIPHYGLVTMAWLSNQDKTWLSSHDM